jgi:hypothetical protein
LKTVDKIFAWILVVMGCIHCGATFIARPHFSYDSVWFFAGGIAFIAAGLLNLIRTQSGKGGLSRIGSIAVNVLLTLACIAIVLLTGLSTFHAPQVMIVTVAIVVELIFSVQG